MGYMYYQPPKQASEFTESMHNYNTKRKSNFRLPKPKTGQLKRTFRYSAAQIWNSLPTDVRQCKRFSPFKLSVKHFLTTN